jgi:hypothetical protein
MQNRTNGQRLTTIILTALVAGSIAILSACATMGEGMQGSAAKAGNAQSASSPRTHTGLDRGR